MNNTDIKREIAAAGLRQWQIAEKYGLNEGNFSRKLRHELTDEEKAKIRGIIADLSQEATA